MARPSKFTPQEKVEMILIGLKSPGSISELCRKYNISPNTYSRWKKNFVHGGLESLRPGTKVRRDMLDRENQKLKQIVGDLYIELEYLKKTLEAVR